MDRKHMNRASANDHVDDFSTRSVFARLRDAAFSYGL